MTTVAPGVAWQDAKVIGGRTYDRAAVRTHLVHVKEPIVEVLQTYVAPVFRPGDFLVLSEKFVAITQGRVIHRSLVRPGLLARLLVKGVTKLKDDVGFSDPAKMQVAIMRAGWARMAFAMVGGGVTRLAATVISIAWLAIASPRSTASIRTPSARSTSSPCSAPRTHLAMRRRSRTQLAGPS